MVKDVKIYLYGLKKKTCLGVLERGERDKNNKTGWKQGKRNRNVNYSAPFAMLAPSLKYLHHNSINHPNQRRAESSLASK